MTPRTAKTATRKKVTETLFAQRYRIEKKLGQGAAGVVYLARDEKMGNQKVALKVVELKKKHDPALIVSLKNEFSTLASLSHRNLARVFDLGNTEKEIYISSEYIDGSDILTATQNANLNTVFQLILQVLRAVDFLHRRGVLHLDLKPANILVTDPNRTGDLAVKLIDFGLAQWSKKGLSFQGEFFGTPPYAAPELIQEQPPRPASDLYALGMIFHRILTHRFPFKSQDPMEIMKEQIYGEPGLAGELPPALPDRLGEILLKMVAKDPSRRFQTPRAVLEAMNECLDENFSLRSPSAPIHILEESDFVFRRPLLADLLKTLSEETSARIILTGPRGSGKSRIADELKKELQLKGIDPLLIRNPEILQGLLKSEEIAPPLLLDFEEAAAVLKNFRVIELPALAEKEILEFLKQEITAIPEEAQNQIAVLSEGRPDRLEQVLQALKEEGKIQWSDQGWHWVSEVEVNFPKLLERQDHRWKESLRRIQEILKFSATGLDAKALEALIGLDAGALEKRLMEWSRKGDLLLEKKEGHPIFRSREMPSHELKFQISSDWRWIQKELQDLYDRGESETASRWADFLFQKNPSLKEIPASVLLIAARNYVAASENRKALESLSSLPPTEEGDRGMYFEIQARARLGLADLEATGEELNRAEDAYRKVGEKAGLFRIFNLRGTLQKRKGEFLEAEKTFQEAVGIASEEGNAYHEAVALMNLATLHQDRGRYLEAHRLYRQALALKDKIPNAFNRCTLEHNWLNHLYHMGRMSEAESDCYELLKYALGHRYVYFQAVAFNYLSLIAGQKNHLEKQLHYLHQAVSLIQTLHFPDRLAQFLVNRGYVYWELKKFPPAQLDAEAAIELVEGRGNLMLAGWADLLLGKILRDRPKPDLSQAAEIFGRAQEKMEKTQNRQMLWEAAFERGLLEKKREDFERARSFFISAHQHLEALLKELPEGLKQTYLRDRKLEKIDAELASIGENL